MESLVDDVKTYYINADVKEVEFYKRFLFKVEYLDFLRYYLLVVKETGIFDESLREEIAVFRHQIEEIWPKLEEAGLSGEPYFQRALKKHPHLKQLYAEGRPVVRLVANLSCEENYTPNSGINITFYWQNDGKIELDTLRTEVELYPSFISLICEWDLGGDIKEGHARREFLPMRYIQREDFPRIKAIISYLQNISNAV